MRKHLWIYTLSCIINSSVFIINIYTVTEEGKVLFPTPKSRDGSPSFASVTLQVQVIFQSLFG